MQHFRSSTLLINNHKLSVYLESYSSDNTDCFYLDTKIRSSTSLFWQKDQKWNEIRWVKMCQYLYTQWLVGCFKLDLKKMSGVLFLRSFPNGSTDASTKTIVVVFSKDHIVVMKQLTNSSSWRLERIIQLTGENLMFQFYLSNIEFPMRTPGIPILRDFC